MFFSLEQLVLNPFLISDISAGTDPGYYVAILIFDRHTPHCKIAVFSRSIPDAALSIVGRAGSNRIFPNIRHPCPIFRVEGVDPTP
jgi:hypothetical protein